MTQGCFLHQTGILPQNPGGLGTMTVAWVHNITRSISSSNNQQTSTNIGLQLTPTGQHLKTGSTLINKHMFLIIAKKWQTIRLHWAQLIFLLDGWETPSSSQRLPIQIIKGLFLGNIKTPKTLLLSLAPSIHHWIDTTLPTSFPPTGSASTMARYPAMLASIAQAGLHHLDRRFLSDVSMFNPPLLWDFPASHVTRGYSGMDLCTSSHLSGDS